MLTEIPYLHISALFNLEKLRLTDNFCVVNTKPKYQKYISYYILS